MKIAVDARTMGSRPSGIGFYLFDFLRELIKKDAFEITLLTDVVESEQIRWMRDQGVPVIAYGKRIFRSVGVYGYFRFVRKHLRTRQPDLFWEPNNLIPMRMRGYRGRIALTIHDLFPLTNPEYFGPVYRKYFSAGIKRSVRMADALLFDSNETRHTVAELLPESREKKSFVSYIIVKPLMGHPVSDKGYFLYVGNLEKRKGTDLLLKAYLRYREKGGDRPLYLGGSVREPEIQVLLDEVRGQCDSVTYLGYLSHQDKCRWLSECGCFLFPSKAEGFGIPPLEAMGYDKPVITGNLSIFEEILRGQAAMFDIGGGEEDQIEALSSAMLAYQSSAANTKTYKDILNRYRPDLLSGKLERFFMDLEESREDCV